MPRVLVITGSNHNFDKCAPLVQGALADRQGIDATLSDNKALLAGGLGGYDVLVLGTGFTRSQRDPDGTVKRLKDLTPEQEQGIFSFVRSGKGFVGIHGTGWWIGGEAVALTGGHANWHPPGLRFTVNVDDREHPITRDLADFEVDDEIYMSAWDPTIRVLATATWAERKHPMAWTHAYGQGRVFFTTLGHGPNTFALGPVQRMLANAVIWAAPSRWSGSGAQ
jgi:type 1 glutamine amidotransferase